MATVERRGERYRLIFYHERRRYTASLKTSDEREADAIAGSVGRTLMHLDQVVARGGLSDAEKKELWDCLYLTLAEVEEFLKFASATSRHGFLHPMLVTAAHTGARRSELLAARVEDLDFANRAFQFREKKRVRGQRSYRRVPLSLELEEVLRDWLQKHPGGRNLFCHPLQVVRSKKHRTHAVPLTRNEAHDHLKRLIADSKWEVLRGWHVCRHSFISNCASKGTDQRLIDE